MAWGVRIPTRPLSADSSSGVTPKASVDGLGTGSPEDSSSAAEKANHTDDPQPQPAPDDKDLFSAVAKLNGHLTTLHAALPARTAFILFSGHSDPFCISHGPVSMYPSRRRRPSWYNESRGNLG
ncbi:hypothetical protein BJV78DRAFT_1198273 [Lactifluus subvellereus]|nr:hypothetical protein BJV78DRAFT_1198273 [Lactifluus subvellereus]